jgi:hypothetical protein
LRASGSIFHNHLPHYLDSRFIPGYKSCQHFQNMTVLPLGEKRKQSRRLLRNAAVSMLTASLTSPTRPPATLAGTGTLSPYLVEAHLAVIPSISRVLIWIWTKAKFAMLIARLRKEYPGLTVEKGELRMGKRGAPDGEGQQGVAGGLVPPPPDTRSVGKWRRAGARLFDPRQPWRRPPSPPALCRH